MARKNNKVDMPMSTAGITRYFENYHTSVELQPGHILFIVAVVVALIIMLHIYGYQMLGLR